MAITAIEFRLFQRLRDKLSFAGRPSVVEFGEANWYGDVPIDQLKRSIFQLVADEAEKTAMRAELDRLVGVINTGQFQDELFEIAKLFYRAFLNPEELISIDLHGTPTAIRHDLNTPMDLGRTFDLALNLGTGEHVFNVYQFCKTVHDVTRAGGYMIHGMPFHGWIDHGFYTFQPTFYWDLAAANDYEVIGLFSCQMAPTRLIPIKTREEVGVLVEQDKIASDAMLYAALHMPETKQEFRAPMQGYYAGTVSEQVREAWESGR